MLNTIRRQLAALNWIALLFAVPLSALAQGNFPGPALHPTPEGFGQYIVYMATGAFDAAEEHPEIDGCFSGQCPGDYFQSEIMGRNPTEILEEEEAAKLWFRERFGLDPDDPALAGRVFFVSFMLDPRGEYRAYSASGSRAPAQGWRVWDGGHALAIIDPNGVELGGEFAGQIAPLGASVAFGNYKIDVTRRNGQPLDPVILRWRSTTPIVPSADGSLHFVCEAEHPDWGTGHAQGLNWATVLDDGRLQTNIRNVLTFPELAE